MNKKYDKSQLIPVVLSSAILAVALIVFAQSAALQSSLPSNLWFGVYGYKCVWVNDKLIDCSPNLITRAGRNMTRDMLSYVNGSGAGGPAAINGTSSISLSNDGTATSDERSVCPSEINAAGLTRAAATIYQVGNYSVAASNISVTYKFTATATQAVQKTCLSNSTAVSGAVLIAEDTFTSVTLNSGDTINITWYIGVT